MYRKRKQCRLEALEKCQEELEQAKAIQLSYDGKIINKMDRYVLLGQYVAEKQKYEKDVAVKTFEKGMSVNAESVYDAISGNMSGNVLKKVYSVMSDTTALNTGKISGVNKRLTEFYKFHHRRNIHSLECLFHVNEIYLTHVIAKIEGKKKGPGAMQEGALMKYFTHIQKPDMSRKLAVPIIRMASLHLRKKMEWFSNEKEKRNNDHSFRTDHLCLLALSSYLLMDVPENMKSLLAYKQEATCHTRWITTASGYLRLLIFDVCHLDDAQKSKLIRLISYIVSIYVPSFLPIHI